MLHIESQWIGLQPYQNSLKLQMDLHSLVLKTALPCVLGLEQEPCVTLGLRGNKDQDLTCSEEELHAKGFELIQVPRGGQATLHSPGQLVIYPIVPLQKWQLRVREYVELLVEASRLCLGQYGLEAKSKSCAPGLYTETGKIAFFGIKIQEGVSIHGLALNVSNRLEDFDLIRSCGKAMAPHDSLRQQGINASPQEVFQCWNRHFKALLLDRTPETV